MMSVIKTIKIIRQVLLNINFDIQGSMVTSPKIGDKTDENLYIIHISLAIVLIGTFFYLLTVMAAEKKAEAIFLTNLFLIIGILGWSILLIREIRLGTTKIKRGLIAYYTSSKIKLGIVGYIHLIIVYAILIHGINLKL